MKTLPLLTAGLVSHGMIWVCHSFGQVKGLRAMALIALEEQRRIRIGLIGYGMHRSAPWVLISRQIRCVIRISAGVILAVRSLFQRLIGIPGLQLECNA